MFALHPVLVVILHAQGAWCLALLHTIRIDYYRAPEWVCSVLLDVINCNDINALHAPCAAGSAF